MNKRKCFTNSGRLVLCSLLLGAVTGCVGYVEESHHVGGYAPAPAVYAQSAVIVQEDYTYYPGYEVYYSGRSRQYVYQEGRAWVSRPAPPRVAVDVLVASPSVRVDFHDAPATHHAAVAQTYPKNWTPPGWDHGNKGGHKKNKDKDN